MESLRYHLLFCRQAIAIIILIGIVGCGGSLHLANQEVIWVDNDQYHLPQPPAEREPDYAWGFIHRSFLHPVVRFLNFSRYFSSNRAENINALGEVPNSSWYTNRHVHKRMTKAQLITGPRQDNGPDLDGTWTIVQGKTEGVTPGFQIRDQKGAVYVIKFDPIDYPELTTGPEIIGTLFFYAAGYNTPENYLVHFNPKKLVIAKGAKIVDRKGITRQMTEADLSEVLARISHRPDGTTRALASKFLPGKRLGPFSYRVRREDDPNDVYHHRNRRELRGFKVVASFLNHVDAKEQNSLDMYITKSGRSYVIQNLDQPATNTKKVSTITDPRKRVSSL